MPKNFHYKITYTNTYMRARTRARTHTHTRTHARTHTHTHACTQSYTHLVAHINTPSHTHSHTHTCMHSPVAFLYGRTKNGYDLSQFSSLPLPSFIALPHKRFNVKYYFKFKLIVYIAGSFKCPVERAFPLI